MTSGRSPDLSDAALVARARRGDAAAFESLVRRHYRAAYAAALGVLGNSMDAEDVAQDAFLRALERLDDLRQPERFASWLGRIVRNRAHNFRSYERVRSAVPLEVAQVASTANPLRDAERSELRASLEAALLQLSQVQREVVVLHDLQGWKHREIAEALGLSEGMSRQHLFAARRSLRERLGARLPEELPDA